MHAKRLKLWYGPYGLAPCGGKLPPAAATGVATRRAPRGNDPPLTLEKIRIL